MTLSLGLRGAAQQQIWRGPPVATVQFTMYDAIHWQAIPADAEAVAGYVDGALSQWPPEAWQRFTAARVVLHISTWGPRNLGDCLDIETGDSTPEEARPWALNAMARGVVRPKLYMGLWDLAKVKALCADLPCLYWVANPTGTPHIPDGADACQWGWNQTVTGGDYDLSLCQPWFA